MSIYLLWYPILKLFPLGAVLGLMNIAIGCIIFEKIFWPWYYMIHEPLPEPRLLRDFIIDTPGVCPICADEDGDCILGSKFDAKTIRSQVSALNVSFKGETTSLRRQRSRRDLSRKPSRRDSSRKSSRRDVSRKSSRKDVSRKNSGRDVSRKSSGRDVSRKSSRKDVSGRKDSSKMDPISRRKRNAERRARRKTTEI